MQHYTSSTMTQIPDDVARLGHEQQLGSPQAGLLVTKLGKGWHWMRFLPLISSLLLIALFPVMFLYADFVHTYLPSSAILFSASLIVVYAAWLISMILFRVTNTLGTLYPCDKGCILRFGLNKFRVVRWDEVETIWQSPTRGFALYKLRRGLIYRLRSHDGEILTLRTFVIGKTPHAAGIKNTEQIIEEYFTRRRLPFQFADYQAGQMLSFGPINVNRNGVTIQDNLLPWEQVADLALRKNRLVITKTGEQLEVWASLVAFKIPNLSILLALFGRIRGGQSQQEEGLQALANYGTATTVVTAARKIDPLPADLAALAEEHQLGERRVDQLLGRKRGIGWPVLILLVVTYTLILSVMAWFSLFTLSHPYFFDYTWARLFMPIMLLIVVILLFLFCLDVVLQYASQLLRATYTFEYGLISRFGKQPPVVYRWDEIASARVISFFRLYFARIPNGYRLQKHDGSALALSHMNINFLNMGTLIKEQIVPLQIPSAIEAFQQGQTRDFSKLRINQQGIVLGERQLPWSQVKSIRQEMNQVVIYDITQRKPWCKLSVMRVPNLFLFFALTDYARDISGPKEPL